METKDVKKDIGDNTQKRAVFTPRFCCKGEASRNGTFIRIPDKIKRYMNIKTFNSEDFQVIIVNKKALPDTEDFEQWKKDIQKEILETLKE